MLDTLTHDDLLVIDKLGLSSYWSRTSFTYRSTTLEGQPW